MGGIFRDILSELEAKIIESNKGSEEDIKRRDRIFR